MFETLPFSAVRPRPPIGHALTSMSLHGAAIVLGVLLTRPSPPAASAGPRVWTIDLPEPLPAAGGDQPIPESAIPTVDQPGLPALPTTITIPDLPSPVIDLPTVARPAWSRPSPGMPISLLPAQGGGLPIGSDGVHPASRVDEPIVPIRQPLPVYPAPLRDAGLTGQVVVEFVVDTLGRVEPGSVRVLESAHPAFEASAREAVLAARFRPAQVGGRPVRQLVRQALRFVLEK